jgi:hypothetical protein
MVGSGRTDVESRTPFALGQLSKCASRVAPFAVVCLASTMSFAQAAAVSVGGAGQTAELAPTANPDVSSSNDAVGATGGSDPEAPSATATPPVSAGATGDGSTAAASPGEIQPQPDPLPNAKPAAGTAPTSPRVLGPRVIHQSSTADADASVPNEAQISAPVREPGYGLTIAAVDLTNVGIHLLAAAAFHHSDRFDGIWPYTFAGGYLLGGPIVHAAYGRAARVGHSLGVRVVVPLTFALIGGLFIPSEEGVAIVDGVGLVSAMVFDAAVLGRGNIVGVKDGRNVPSIRPWVEPRVGRTGVYASWAF